MQGHNKNMHTISYLYVLDYNYGDLYVLFESTKKFERKKYQGDDEEQLEDLETPFYPLLNVLHQWYVHSWTE